MHDDDRPNRRLLSRRHALSLLGAGTAATLAHRVHGMSSDPRPSMAAAAPDCIALPVQTEGPYFVDRALERSDIWRDPATGRVSPGAPLALRFELSEFSPAANCLVLSGAQVDIWHCDAMGVYSGVEDRRGSTVGSMVLRGYQVSDANGVVRFTTIYPGWYPGRAVHIHFKVRVPAEDGRTDEFTSQLYFSDEVTDRVHAREPYSAHRGQRLLNPRDMIFREGGSQLVLPVVESEERFAATFRIAVQPDPSRRVSSIMSRHRHGDSGRG
jgi:protocatechuate 3,4-dioxygenase beta subunit